MSPSLSYISGETLQLATSFPSSLWKPFACGSATVCYFCGMSATEPIRIGKDTKEELKRLKIHPRETYDDVIKRLIEEYKRSRHAKDQRS
ncbi:MAG: hypothetical protein QXW41_06290 [Fervidicoccaceae archaeon]